MEKVTITVDSAVYEFYRKVGLLRRRTAAGAGHGRRAVQAGRRFEPAGAAQKSKKMTRRKRVIFLLSHQPMVTLVFLGNCFLAALGMDSCRMPFSNLAVTSSGSTSSPT